MKSSQSGNVRKDSSIKSIQSEKFFNGMKNTTTAGFIN